MSILTLISDLGADSPFVGQVKGRLYSLLPEINVVDITHGIRSFDLAATAYNLRRVFPFFPPGTIHLVGVVDSSRQHQQLLLATFRGHHFICADNGILPQVLDVDQTEFRAVPKPPNSLFTFRDLMPVVASQLLSGEYTQLYPLTSRFQTGMESGATARPGFIKAQVVYVDNFGNLHLNVNREIFGQTFPDGKYQIRVTRKDHIEALVQHYDDVESGELFALFNSDHFLMIGVHSGNASGLFGLEVGKTVFLDTP